MSLSPPSSDKVAINPRDAVHESLCTPETRVCWIEFASSLACLILGLVCVLVGVSADSSAVGPNAGLPSKVAQTAGPRAATFFGVAMLLAGAALMVAFGVHFYLVKRRLDRVRFHRFARLGIRPTSRYSALPAEVADAPLPAEDASVSVVSSPATLAAATTRSGFFNLGFSGVDGTVDSRPPADDRRSSAATSSGIGSFGSPASSSIAMAVNLPPVLLPPQSPQPRQPQMPPPQPRMPPPQSRPPSTSQTAQYYSQPAYRSSQI